MKILSKILNVICDPFRKIASMIDVDHISKFVSRHTFIIYIFAAVITGILFGLAYFWL